MIREFEILELQGLFLAEKTGSLFSTLEILQQDYPTCFIYETSTIPADFSCATYTIENGELVKASNELIAEREAAARVASHEVIRTEREQRYESEPIKSLYWNWIESGLESDRTLWIAAKNAVRDELPYPEKPTAV